MILCDVCIFILSLKNNLLKKLKLKKIFGIQTQLQDCKCMPDFLMVVLYDGIFKMCVKLALKLNPR